jgi:hypothetical protein
MRVHRSALPVATEQLRDAVQATSDGAERDERRNDEHGGGPDLPVKHDELLLPQGQTDYVSVVSGEPSPRRRIWLRPLLVPLVGRDLARRPAF